MSIHRLWTIIRKEFRHIWRDKRILFLVTLSPAIMLLTFSYLFAMQVEKSRLGVWDMDQSATSRRFIATLTSDGKFVLTRTLTDYAGLRDALVRGDIHVGLVIPPGFESDLVNGQRAPIQVIADGSDAITSSQSLGRFNQRVAEFNKQIAPETSNLVTIGVQAQAWFNPDLNNMYAMVPGLIPIVMILPSLAIALALTRERELGSFETLITAPIRPVEYLLGKLIPYMVYGLISATIAILLALAWFQVPLRGSVLDLGLLTLCYLFALLGETLFISGFISSQGTAMRVILIIFFIPSFFLAGVTLPVDTSSGFGQIASFLLPASHFVEITRGLFLKGLGLDGLLSPALTLVALGAIPFILGLLTFRKQVD
ncbi:MAG: ABC transporter permease [Anaerolineae bacterium]